MIIYVNIYMGVLVDHEAVDNERYTSHYIYQHPRANYAIDAEDPLSCYGRYINDSLSMRKTNCQFTKYSDSDNAYMIASKDIKKGEEIFVKYGKSYWSGENLIGLPQLDLDFIHNDYNDDDDEDEYEEEYGEVNKDDDDDEEYIPPILKKTRSDVIDLTEDEEVEHVYQPLQRQLVTTLPNVRRYRPGIIPVKGRR